MSVVQKRLALIVAAVLAVSGVVGVVTLLSAGSVRSWIDGTFTRVSGQPGGRSLVYSSTQPPLSTADRIAGRWRPSDRLNEPGGSFLRYRDTIVAVTGDGGRGSRIYVDDDDDGYARWYPYLGGWWGTGGGSGSSFRGGGPGEGK
jgi:hypothetical protein